MAFTNEEIIAAIDTVVEGREDFVYDVRAAELTEYSYTDCLVGQVCGALDPQIQADLIEWEKQGAKIADRIRSRFTRKQIEILSYGQLEQDAGCRWGLVAEGVKRNLMEEE